MAEQIVSDLGFDRSRIHASASGITEAMLPAEEWQAQTFGTGLPELFVDVPFFAAEFAEVRIETEPGVTSTRKQPEPLRGDLERWRIH